ncbi:MAG: hypothetical protein ABJB22_07920 [Verrucomicrobiota bacterium]
MITENLGTYLKEHFAGSVGAVELLDHLIGTHSGGPLESFFIQLRTEIAADQDELRDLMHALEVKESTVKNAGAWMAEKFAQVKLRFDGEKQDGLALLQAFEALVLGITGKLLLWRALEAAVKDSAQLRPMDFKRLQQRALEQRDRVEAKRLETARQIFISG